MSPIRIALSLLLLIGVVAPEGAAAGIRGARGATLQAPLDPAAWAALGDAYRKRGRIRAAAAAYERALSLLPGDAEISGKLATLGVGRATGRLERRALRNPHDDELWGDLADAYLARGRRETALQYYLYAMRVDPSDSEWRNSITALGGSERITEELRAAIESGAADDEVVGDYGDALWEAGEHDSACDSWTRASELDPSDTEWQEKLGSQCGLAEAYGAWGGEVGGLMGGIEPQLNTLSRGSDSQGLAGVARSKLLAGDREGALSDYQRALMLEPTDQDAMHAVLVLSGATRVEVLERLTERLPDSDELWGDLGDCYLGLGRLDESQEAYERALALDPNDEEWSSKLLVIRPLPPSGDLEDLGFGPR